ncbi:MAG: HAD family hydrolase [Acidobacteriota bacterium]|nr:HAD family hydrolase [Acidobacteriota bacterium]
MAALFFDVDGTLIDSYHENRSISPAVRAELARVQALGHMIFLSSGRSRMLLTPALLEPGFDGLVLINGGYVEMDGESLFEERMDFELAHETVAFLEDQGCEYLITAAHRTYMRESCHELYGFFESGGHGDIFTFDYDLDEALSQAIKMEALVPMEDRARVTARALEVLGTRISCDGHGGEGTFELYPTAISKAKGIEVVLDRLGIGAQDAYAFGDGTNDLEMIRHCGCGVAMGNAEDVVKAEADIVCPPVWDDGLAQALRMLFA